MSLVLGGYPFIPAQVDSDAGVAAGIESGRLKIALDYGSLAPTTTELDNMQVAVLNTETGGYDNLTLGDLGIDELKGRVDGILIGGAQVPVADQAVPANTTNAMSSTVRIVAEGAGGTITLSRSLVRGTAFSVIQMGAGQIAFTPAAGASLINSSGHDRTARQYSAVTLLVIDNVDGASAQWLLMGDTA